MPKRFTEVKTNEHLCGTWEDYISVDATQLGTQCNSVVAMYNGHGFIVCNMTPNRWREWPEWALEVELSGLYKSWEAEVFKDEKVTTWLVSAMENTDNDKLQRIIHDITGRQPSVFVYVERGIGD
ncbi:uncharacterized protein N7515_000420 [Penicillium bovifimosum]|uniref:Uncharacterized protein n=1 Tax=Penicillium bovifimosum TaxID=126998 RepID=A0A9W9LBF2_9EURO|nr:uncharacterized protein N7515_000420 [Penicillium bovifimosum]KAJ5145856.1 hypothetical protein N7515_000420 [Penicillium bovifimosum]